MTGTTFNLDDLSAIERMPRYYRWKRDLVVPHLPAGARILEVGCGTGFFMEQLVEDAAFIGGIDPDAGCTGRAARRFAGRPQFAVETLDILDAGHPPPAAWRPNAAVFINALEYIPDDRGALARTRALLAPGSRLVVFASALPGLSGELDKSMGQHRYRREELREKIAGAGFSVSRLDYANLIGAVPWWWESRVLGRPAVTAADYGSRDRWVPLARLVDALTGPPIGRSLLAVATAT